MSDNPEALTLGRIAREEFDAYCHEDSDYSESEAWEKAAQAVVAALPWLSRQPRRAAIPLHCNVWRAGSNVSRRSRAITRTGRTACSPTTARDAAEVARQAATPAAQPAAQAGDALPLPARLEAARQMGWRQGWDAALAQQAATPTELATDALGRKLEAERDAIQSAERAIRENPAATLTIIRRLQKQRDEARAALAQGRGG